MSKSSVVILKLWNIVNNSDYGEFRTAIFFNIESVYPLMQIRRNWDNEIP